MMTPRQAAVTALARPPRPAPAASAPTVDRIVRPGVQVGVGDPGAVAQPVPQRGGTPAPGVGGAPRGARDGHDGPVADRADHRISGAGAGAFVQGAATVGVDDALVEPDHPVVVEVAAAGVLDGAAVQGVPVVLLAAVHEHPAADEVVGDRNEDAVLLQREVHVPPAGGTAATDLYPGVADEGAFGDPLAVVSGVADQVVVAGGVAAVMHDP